MPTYEYRCKDCSHELEAQQSFSDDPLTVCPTCGGSLRKKFSSVGISFKGSGFYKTDSRGSGTSTASSSSSSSSSSSDSAGSGGSSDTTTSSSTGSGDNSAKAPAAASA